jgi:hypothetical protein
MRVKEITEGQVNEFVAQPDPVISEEDIAAILSVRDEDFSQPMTGDELMEHLYAVLGVQK